MSNNVYGNDSIYEINSNVDGKDVQLGSQKSQQKQSAKPEGKVAEQQKMKLSPTGEKLKKAIITGVVVVTVGVTGTIVGLRLDNNTPNFKHTAAEIVQYVSDESVIDEVLEIVDSNAVADLDTLAEKVELSERLHELNLEKYIGDLDKLEMPETYSVEEVNEMIDEIEELCENEKVKNGVLCEESREFTQLALNLEAYERAVNGSLSNLAYQELIDYAMPCVKAKVLDACGFDASEVNYTKIGKAPKSYVITFDDPKTGQNYSLNVYSGNSLTSKGYAHTVIEQIYSWQSKTNKAEDTGTSYDGDRNDDILDGINSLKAFTLMDCEITEKGDFKVTTKMSEVRAKEKALSAPTATDAPITSK